MADRYGSAEVDHSCYAFADWLTGFLRAQQQLVTLERHRVEYASYSGRTHLRLEFREIAEPWHWQLPLRLQPREAVSAFSHQVPRIFWRVYEDERFRRELEPQRQLIRRLYELGAPRGAIVDAEAELHRLEHHYRRHHDRPTVAGLDYGRRDATTVVTRAMRDMPTVAAPIPPETYAALERRMRREIEDAFFVPLGRLTYDARAVEEKRRAAQARAEELLKSWLNPEQLVDYERGRAFTVTGSRSGKHYRIRHGRQQNVFELDAKGREIRGLCFLPQGGLVEGDCMLAQKIALETDERAALKVAIAFPVGGRNMTATEALARRYEFDMRPGAINWIDG